MTVKRVLDDLFSKVKFDKALYAKIIQFNIEFITSTDDHKQLFGGKAVGCYYLSYDFRHKDQFWEGLFGLETDDVIDAIKTIDTIPSHFTTARDDINLGCFYIAHRFISNPKLDKKSQHLYARSILDYFSYRTLVHLHASYYKYPISKEKAVSLTERLSNRYMIKKVKNWNAFCEYRSENYLKGSYVKVLTRMNDDSSIPNAIVDLMGGTKSAMINIYKEFVNMMEKDDLIQSSKSVISGDDGSERMLDRVGGSESYVIKLEAMLVDESSFIKEGHVLAAVDIIPTTSDTIVKNTLRYMLDYTFSSSKARDEVYDYVRETIVVSIDYLTKNSIYMTGNTSVIKVMDQLVGNILFARGTDLQISRLKDRSSALVKKIYKQQRKTITDRNVNNVRNALYVYIMLLALA